MPELPEVENVKRSLEPQIIGKRIAQVEVRLNRIVRSPRDIVAFCENLAGKTVMGLNRRGKYLLFDIPPYTLVSHLRMEGQYKVARHEEDYLPHTHVVFRFDDGTELRYRDVRQFGTMDLVQSEDDMPSGLKQLGPEPFDVSWTAKELQMRLSHRKAPIKAVLLDQTIMAGLGNIYVDEALFEARIHPLQPANRLTRPQASRLLSAIRSVLERAIEAGGSSVKTYVDGYGRHGGFQMQLNVYAREGEPCRRCGREIQKLRVAGRGTHVCTRCQRVRGTA